MNGLNKKKKILFLTVGDDIGQFFVFKFKEMQFPKLLFFADKIFVRRVAKIQYFCSKTEAWQELLYYSSL